MPEDRDQQTPADPADRERQEGARRRGTSGAGDDQLPGEPGGPAPRLAVLSAAFDEGDELPHRYARTGDNLSPPLEWSEPPPGTAEVAVLCEDPDAPRGVFTHWVVSGIDPRVTELPEGEIPPGATVGLNDFGGPGWDGPQPPPGQTHRYIFSVFASAEPIDLPPRARGRDLRKIVKRTELAEGRLVVLASR